jgi:hypothetical protein
MVICEKNKLLEVTNVVFRIHNYGSKKKNQRLIFGIQSQFAKFEKMK